MSFGGGEIPGVARRHDDDVHAQNHPLMDPGFPGGHACGSHDGSEWNLSPHARERDVRAVLPDRSTRGAGSKPDPATKKLRVFSMK